MAHYVERSWNPEDRAGLSKKDRTPGKYFAYVPDELGVNLPQVSPAAQEAAAEALVVLARADERLGERSAYLSHLLVRSESISSSWIEGNRIKAKKLAIAETLQNGTRVALDVVANVRATELAIAEIASSAAPITSADIEHLQHAIEPRLEYGLRREQNWVGGSGWSPLRADFVPPPAEEVPRLVDDVARFISTAEGNAVIRAAIAHAQFETIHPFVDGNGRTGRALIHTVLRRSEAVRNILIPISTVFAGNADSYIAGLTSFREIPSLLDQWVISFAEATVLAAEYAVSLSKEVNELDTQLLAQFIDYRATAGFSPATPRKDAVSLRILSELASHPVLTAEFVSSHFAVSPAAAHRALGELCDAGVISRTKDHKGKLLCWVSDRHLGLVDQAETRNRGINTSTER